MKIDSQPVYLVFKKIANSDRLTVVLATLLIVAGSMLAVLVERAIVLAQSNAALQFRELEGAFSEHERFMLGWKLHDAELVEPNDGKSAPAVMTTPGWALVGTESLPANAKPAELAHSFIDFYRDFWSQSRYRPSQCLLVNGAGTHGVLAPSKYSPQYQKRGTPTQLRSALGRIHQAVLSRPRLKAGYVAWTEEPWIDGQVRFVAVTSAPEDAAHWGEGAEITVPAIACLMETNGLLADLSASGSSEFSQFSLFTPAGTRLIGDSSVAHNGPSKLFGLRGLELRMQGRGGWTAVYTVSLQQLLLIDRGTLLAGGLLASAVGVAGALLLRTRRTIILEQLRAHDERLLESQEFSRAILDSAPVGVCLLRRHDDSILLDNVRVRRFLGGDHEHGGWQGTWRQQVQADNAEQDIAYTTPDGRHLLVSATAVRFDGEDAQLCLFMDVTLQREAGLAMHAAQVASEAANQAKSQFLAMISHEIRTPLYGVLGTLELLGLTTLEPRQREYLRTVERSSSTLMHLIDDILDISKAESGQLQLDVSSFSPALLTEDIVMAWNGTARNKGLTLYAIIDAQSPAAISGDATRVRQVLDNLLSNAIKFTEQGRVTLRLSKRIVGEKELISWEVSDSGIGISTEAQARLFERFYQVHPGDDGKQGTGLGLTICSLLATLMGGSIAVTSQPGLGSSFTLEIPFDRASASPILPTTASWPLSEKLLVRGEPKALVHSLIDRLTARGIMAVEVGARHVPSPSDSAPLLEILLGSTSVPTTWSGPHVLATCSAGEQPEPADGCWQVTVHRLDAIVEALLMATGSPSSMQGAQVTQSLQAVRQLGLKVLVAEDNPINQAILRDQLQQLGCKSVIASDGREALGYCSEQPFSLLLTDLQMPVMDGFTLSRAVRDSGLALPIVGTTANGDPGEWERCRLAGMDRVLIKPIALRDLQSALLEMSLVRSRKSGLPELGPSEPLAVPARHRLLFVQTMEEDLRKLRQAMTQRSAAQSAALLHRICGALTLAGAHRLASLGTFAEHELRQSPTPSSGWDTTRRFLAAIEESLRAMAREDL